MDAVRETERLESLYAGYGDGQLLDLAADRANLTDEGQLALRVEMNRRGLKADEVSGAERESGFGPGVAGVLASNVDVLGHGPGVLAEPGDGLVVLIEFYNGHELAQACGALEQAGIGLAVETVGGDAIAGVPASFAVRVAAEDVVEAQSLLRAEMQLFPLPEMMSPLMAEDDGTMEVVAEFETRAEAEEAMTVLAGAGLEAKLRPSELEGEAFAVEVKAVQREQALELVAERMGL